MSHIPLLDDAIKEWKNKKETPLHILLSVQSTLQFKLLKLNTYTRIQRRTFFRLLLVNIIRFYIPFLFSRTPSNLSKTYLHEVYFCKIFSLYMLGKSVHQNKSHQARQLFRLLCNIVQIFYIFKPLVAFDKKKTRLVYSSPRSLCHRRLYLKIQLFLSFGVLCACITLLYIWSRIVCHGSTNFKSPPPIKIISAYFRLYYKCTTVRYMMGERKRVYQAPVYLNETFSAVVVVVVESGGGS